MARSVALGMTLAVLAAHLIMLQALGSLWAPASQLKAMAIPFFTRELHSSVPAPPVPVVQAKKRTPDHTRTPSVAINTIANEPPLATPQSGTVTEVVEAITIGPQNASAAPASEPADGTRPTADQPIPGNTGPQPAHQDDWPVDTRLSYKLTGYYRGPIGGEGRVQWQRQGNAYQVRVELDLSNVTIFTMTSQGLVATDGLEPAAYEEKRLGTKPLQVTMERQAIRLNDGKRVERPSQAQDTASQFVELGHRFATGRARLEVGTNVQLWLARPGAAAEWTYDIVALDTLESPRLGAIQAYHLKPRPLDNPNGPVTAEMWFAPSLQYLPVRIKITMNAETWVDLLIDKIEQAAPAPATPPSDAAPVPPIKPAG